MIAAAVLLLAAVPAAASWMKLYEGPGCRGKSKVFFYGCHEALFRGGFDFTYEDDENAFVFRDTGCARRNGDEECEFFGESIKNCSRVLFRSFHISKPPPLSCELGYP